MNPTLAVGLLWPLEGADAWQGLLVVAFILGLLAVVPVGWLVIRRRFGTWPAGPLWPLALFILMASLYALLTPPWQTPDEPRHMVYVELVRRSGTEVTAQLAGGKRITAEQSTVAADVHNTVLRSLEDVDRWPASARHVIDAGGIPGPPEVRHPPLYYLTAAAVTAPLGKAPIVARVGVLRAFGVMMAGWVIWLCGAAGRMLWPKRRLAEAPIAIAAGVPAFAALAGTVNSDVLANLLGALVLVSALAISRPNVPVRRWQIFAIVALVLLGVLTKRSFVPLIPAVLLVVLVRKRFRLRQILAAAVVAQLLVGVAVLTAPSSRPALWQGSNTERCDGRPHGDRAVCIRDGGIAQPLTVTAAERLAGSAASLGFWTRSDAGAVVTATTGVGPPQSVAAGPNWTFHRVSIAVPELEPYSSASQTPLGRTVAIRLNATGPVALDGVVLARGEFPETPPQYLHGGREVVWGGIRARNDVGNGSFEDSLINLPGWVPSSMQRTAVHAVNATYSLLRDRDRVFEASSLIRDRLGGTFGIFWGTVGWDQPPRLFSPVVLWVLGGLTGLGLAAAALSAGTTQGRVWRDRRGVVLLGAVAAVILAVVFRGLPPTDTELVSGRYLFPALLAVAVCLAAGWRSLVAADDLRFRRWTRIFAVSTQATFMLTVFLPFRLG